MDNNIVDQWMSLLGLRRQAHLAALLSRGDGTITGWKKDNRIPAPALVTLMLIAQTRGIEVPEWLAQPMKSNNGAAP